MVKIITSVANGNTHHVELLCRSLEIYSTRKDLLIYNDNPSTNFGWAFNNAIKEFTTPKDTVVIICNDDIVITPTTIPKMLTDIEFISREFSKWGFIGARSNEVRACQNIRNGWPEDQVLNTNIISPIFAALNLAAFYEVNGFPPINWYSDDVICEDMNALGYSHWVSRAYVHHTGSATVGHNQGELAKAGLEWVKQYRPQYLEKWFPGVTE